MRRLVQICGLLVAATAAAHPLGNFTINRYAALHVVPDGVHLTYVVDMAEIPTFQVIQRADADGDGRLGMSEQTAYRTEMQRSLAAGLELARDGTRAELEAEDGRLELVPGAGGLPTLRLELHYRAEFESAGVEVTFYDRNFPGRVGWQEVLADTAAGVRLADADVPAVDRSQALRAYPADLLAAPPQVTSARLRVEAGAAEIVRDDTPAGERVGAKRFSDQLTELIASREPVSARFLGVALLLAAGLGALHALSPGHGKTIVGAYLVGSRGTAWHALLLGLVVTATHTIGVYLLGGATLVAEQYVVPDQLLPWLSLASGLLVLTIGSSLAMARLRAALGLGDAGHHHHHPHTPGHAHGGPHHHLHHTVPPDTVGWRGLVALGVSGGLLPCPSALVVMLGAIALGRTLFGLALIVAFSAGLAAVLTGIGLALVFARRWLDRLPSGGRVVRFAPVVSAVVIVAAGVAMVAQALVQVGVLS